MEIVRCDPLFSSGPPELSFHSAMHAEHCLKEGSVYEFETSNYHIKTTTKKEWDIVTTRMPVAPSEARHGRRVPVLAELALLPTSIKANLYIFEIISLVLYTGPMVSEVIAFFGSFVRLAEFLGGF
jgi:hypothetical protein